jgi:hypothetical protein
MRNTNGEALKACSNVRRGGQRTKLPKRTIPPRLSLGRANKLTFSSLIAYRHRT